MQIEFNSFTPDQPPNGNAGMTRVDGTLPGGIAYVPFASPVSYGTGLMERAQGASSAHDIAGNTSNFAGSATRLNKFASGTWNNVSKVGGYNTGSQEVWKFLQFGARMLATNLTDPVQSYDLALSSLFANYSANAPKGRYLTTVKSQIVIANVDDSYDGIVPHRLWFSPIGGGTDWTPSATTQCDFQDLDSSKGWIQGVVGGEYGIIFQERAITKMTYIGSPLIYQFDELEDGFGCPAPGSIVKISTGIFYQGIDGFYVFNGQNSTPIGENQINKTYYKDLDQNYLDRVTATIDPINTLYIVSYPGVGNDGGLPNKYIAYNYSPSAKKKWTMGFLTTEMIWRSLAEGYTLDGLDVITTNLDLLPYSLDSRVWTGNQAFLSGFNSSHQMINFTGVAQDTLLETGEVEINAGFKTLVTKMRPFIEGYTNVTLQLGGRDNLNDAVTWSNVSTADLAGNFPFRFQYRYIRARVLTTGAFSFAQGLDVVEQSKLGSR